jgi:hypothetical protein
LEAALAGRSLDGDDYARLATARTRARLSLAFRPAVTFTVDASR